ncbi:squalene--hopene cyclase [Phragmitibacter flavus]|uniref:Squalene--hopene cyclase n=1 Tax=Phragmitibacter flavus TaxID=2576071 RepID=A0A5R8KII9_9BACT|nr:prenyltransferase/squalene oxidase repeat-containing protein [Phragmitibacter flavus]TLD71775.1 squalene--hopene cyclase [Phragmitibacter flavus]
MLDQAIFNTREHLLSLRNEAGFWEGELASSALATATAVVALSLVDEESHDAVIRSGVDWLMKFQNEDGGWGDTTLSGSNLSTTLLCWSALQLVMKNRLGLCGETLVSQPVRPLGPTIARGSAWIEGRVGSLEPGEIQRAVVARYGKDKTFSVPILMLCAIGGTLGRDGWRMVLPLPFELAALPRTWFGAVGLPVVSYALPALIAIGYARHVNAPFAWWNPLRWLRSVLWRRVGPMLKELQPETGGYLEATPLTSFVTMALASAGQKKHACVPEAVRFLVGSQRADGSWPIDTNLATWGTTLAVKSMGEGDERVKDWLLGQQYEVVHPFTNAAPGGWAWTDLPGGVPDADDTPGALVALWELAGSDEVRRGMLPKVEAAVGWLLDLQNRDGGMPTFCRGWGALPFDRSTPELTSHALWAWGLWGGMLSEKLRERVGRATDRAWEYLQREQRADGSWVPLWFGNEHAPEEENPVHGTAMVLQGAGAGRVELSAESMAVLRRGAEFLLAAQGADGGWGGAKGVVTSIEETANAVMALVTVGETGEAVERGARWLVQNTEGGTVFPAAPIGLYFARLWYHERLYPVVWTMGALRAVAPGSLQDAENDTQDACAPH